MRVLIAGATGLIGSRITQLFQKNAIGVNYLSTSREKIENRPDYRGFYWNPSTGEIDSNCLEGVGAIINLAGENIFGRWTKEKKQRILESRLNSVNLLFKILEENEHHVGQIASASAIGIYPHSYHKIYYEDEQEVDPGFLGQVVAKWEASVDKFKGLGLRVAKLRIGLVLSKNGGALPKMQKPFEYKVGAVLGNGNQWQSWIHIDDVAGIFLFVIQNGLRGVYNAVSPDPVKHQDLMREIAISLDKKIHLPNVPAFVLKLALGEMATMVLSSQLVASKKIEEIGYQFRHTNLQRALQQEVPDKK